MGREIPTFEGLEPYDGKLSRTVLRGQRAVMALRYPVFRKSISLLSKKISTSTKFIYGSSESKQYRTRPSEASETNPEFNIITGVDQFEGDYCVAGRTDYHYAEGRIAATVLREMVDNGILKHLGGRRYLVLSNENSIDLEEMRSLEENGAPLEDGYLERLSREIVVSAKTTLIKFGLFKYSSLLARAELFADKCIVIMIDEWFNWE